MSGNRREEREEKGTTYDGDVVDGGVVVEENASAVDVVALHAHVQRRQAVLGLGDDRCASLEQQVHHLVVSATSGTVQRRQTILQHSRRSCTLKPSSAHKEASCSTDAHMQAAGRDTLY